MKIHDMNARTLALHCFVGVVVSLTIVVAEATADGPIDSVPEGNRHLLLACGLPGDDGHRQRLDDACRKILAAAENTLGIATDRMTVLVGDPTMQSRLTESSPVAVSVCTRESLEAALISLGAQANSNDECWIVLLGHSHLYNGSSQFNVQGPDFDQTQFAGWTKSLTSNRQVFWLTMPVSGFWIKPLSNPTRCIVSATEADLEFTGTEMPYALADVLAGDGETETVRDVDGDGVLSLLDLYLAVNLEIHGRFTSMERLQTEHAQLDDNGDGRGSEVQSRYLPEPKSDDDESESEAPDNDEASQIISKLPAVIDNESLDGYRSRQILLQSPKTQATDES